ncbi:MAG: hypothetical protein AVDCRST_MAG90-1187 [uncultured Microvirga sp.]|uniref:Uncharacterized protein n=1 Tax=uncultured Microvirga sp. TaxID=412392 RepID=A0A6J4L712_9HYPH|nr:MAG: hypothetical protein AVDCRST_MAG90-1187 [uncultured Microvirga sp.]
MARTPKVEFDIDDNDEQRDADQAQDVARDAVNFNAKLAVSESERGGNSDPTAVTPDDVPDLVDTMNQMVSSGHIDNGAFAGEPMHDDEEDRLGQTEGGDDDAFSSTLNDRRSP